MSHRDVSKTAHMDEFTDEGFFRYVDGRMVQMNTFSTFRVQ